jgi:ribosomal protein L11 methyltransferase
MNQKFPDYLRIAIPAREDYEIILDNLMDEGLLPGFESTDTAFVAWILESESSQLLKRLKAALPAHHLEISVVPGQDWNQRWKENFKALQVGKRFWITPPWDIPQIKPDEQLIIIQPGQAFGTGTHESTQLAIALLEDYFAGGSVLDIGCGSGILAIAAHKLGAHSVRAFDYDPLFMENMTENLALNQISDIQYDVADALEMEQSNADWLLINIEKRIILPLLKHFQKIGENPKNMILSGLLTSDVPEIIKALDENGYQLIEHRLAGEWSAIIAGKRENPIAKKLSKSTQEQINEK